MIRTGGLLLVTAVLASLAVGLIEIRTGADAILARGTPELNTLDTPAGRGFVVALESSDRTARASAVRQVADLLAGDPAVALVNEGPVAPSRAFLEWLWEHRFRLAPPATDDLTVAGLSRHLAEARGRLSGGDGFLFGDRLLRDPTGSFARVLQQFSSASADLAHQDGIWQSRDGDAALLFVTLAERPFDTGEVAALADRVRERAGDKVSAHLLGPRIVSAEIGRQAARESTRAALMAGALLIGWLVWVLRSLRALAFTVLPLACGLAAACLAVQLLFGSVHVIALGFGGVLAGLALDYPLHLLCHPGAARPGAGRLVILGALTTAVGFLAMLGSGVPALMQTGVFVAVGLLVACLVSCAIPAGDVCSVRSPPLERLVWRMPYRVWLETLLLVAGIAFLAGTPADPGGLFEPPDRIRESMARVSGMVALPSGRHAVLIEGKDLAELLTREAELQETLDVAISVGLLSHYTMLASHLSATATLPEIANPLPTGAVFRARAALALRQNGMAPAFADQQAADYLIAREMPAVGIGALKAFAETRALAAQLDRTPGGLREVARLYGVKDPVTLAQAITDHGIPGVHPLDLAAPIQAAMADLRRQVMLWLGAGLVSAVLVLLLAYVDRRKAAAVARTTGAAVALTAILMTILAGPLGVFEIVALTLLFGIGIDYGLFLAPSERGGRGSVGAEGPGVADYRSVGLCALSTLVGFSTLAISSVKLLHDIGTTVILGVLLVLLFHLGGSARVSDR